MNKVFYLLLTITSTTLFSMHVERGKYYKLDDGTTVFIEKKYASLAHAIGAQANLSAAQKACLRDYVRCCVMQSGKEKTTPKLLEKIITGDQETINTCIDPQYSGEFLLGSFRGSRGGLYYSHEQTIWLKTSEIREPYDHPDYVDYGM